jgi:carboxylesterase
VVRGKLGAVRSPLLVVHGRRDHTAPFSCSDELLRRAGAPLIRRRALPKSWHLVSLDVERDVVVAEVGAFFDAALTGGAELE